MPWFYVDDDMAFNRKIVAAGNPAVGLWTRAGSWSRKEGTHGFIPLAIARTLGTPAQITKLVGARLWHEVDAGYQFHEWTDRYNPDQEAALKRKRSEAGRLGGRKSGQTRSRTEASDEANASNFAESNAQANSEAEPKQNRTHVLVPVLGSGQVGREGSESIARENEPPSKCFKHRLDPNPPPCGPCAGFRREHDEWIAERKRLDSEAKSVEARRVAEVRARAIERCDLCDDDGYRAGRVCDHDPDSVDRAARGMASVRAAMTRPARDA